MVKYTQAIAVDKDFMYALLINRLNEPGKGQLSGVGGHIEKDEQPKHCIYREWEEEVGSPIPDNAEVFPLFTVTDKESENNMFGIILPKIDIYFIKDMDEGIIRWHHIQGEKIMQNMNKNVAWNGMIPYCINLMKLHKNV